MKYEPIPEMTRAEIDSAIFVDNSAQLVYAALSAAFYVDDPHWVQNVCERLAEHPNANVRGHAIEGFAHIARIHGSLDARVKPLIERALCDEDSWVRMKAHDAAGDVAHFLKWDFALEDDASN
jgi:HEAT repeat protein